MNSMDTTKLNVRQQLSGLARTFTDIESECMGVMNFMEKVDNPFTRKNLSGHITASGWVVDESMTKALLIYHKVLKIWVQPGGHIEMGEDPIGAAFREVFEETGLSQLTFHPPGLLDVDIHSIPESKVKGEPEHYHYDLRYLLVADAYEVSRCPDEVEEVKWIELDVIANMPEMFLPSISRMARRTLDLLDQQSTSDQSASE